MYLEVFQYRPNYISQVESIQQEIRDFTNSFPQFEIVKTESFITGEQVTIHVWYKEKGDE